MLRHFLRNFEQIYPIVIPSIFLLIQRAWDLSLSLENEIKPYTSFGYLEEGDYVFEMLKNNEINYAILEQNLFNEEDLERESIDLKESEEPKYIKDNFSLSEL